MASFRRRGKVWYFTYTDQENRRVERKGFSDKKETQRLAAEIEIKVRREREGLSDPRLEAAKKWRGHLLSKHLEDYRAYMQDRGNRKNYIKHSTSLIGMVIRDFKFLSDFTQESVMARLSAMRSEGRLDTGRSQQTLILCRAAAKRFSRWLYKQNRSATNILADLEPLRGKETPRRLRRVLTKEEVEGLLRVASSRRGLAYSLLLATGLRIGELTAATASSFLNLRGKTPKFLLKREQTKTGREAEIPVPQPLAERVAKVIEQEPLTPESRINWDLGSNPNKTFNNDVSSAGLSRKTAQGQIDPHAFRTTAITWLIASGANVKEVQEFARHASPVTTLKFYAKVTQERIRELAEWLAASTPQS